LTEVEEKEEEEEGEGFKLYIRIRKTTVGEMKTVIEQLRQTRPVNFPALEAMEKSLEGEGEDSQVVYEKYIGETIISVKGRQQSDLQTARSSKSVFSRWLHRLALQQGMGNQEKFKLFTVDLGDTLPVKPEGYTGTSAPGRNTRLANR